MFELDSIEKTQYENKKKILADYTKTFGKNIYRSNDIVENFTLKEMIQDDFLPFINTQELAISVLESFNRKKDNFKDIIGYEDEADKLFEIMINYFKNKNENIFYHSSNLSTFLSIVYKLYEINFNDYKYEHTINKLLKLI